MGSPPSGFREEQGLIQQTLPGKDHPSSVRLHASIRWAAIPVLFVLRYPLGTSSYSFLVNVSCPRFDHYERQVSVHCLVFHMCSTARFRGVGTQFFHWLSFVLFPAPFLSRFYTSPIASFPAALTWAAYTTAQPCYYRSL